MDILCSVLDQDTVDRLVPDAKELAAKHNPKNKSELSKLMGQHHPYWRNEVTMGNPLQEAIVLDSLWRIIYRLPTYSGPYCN